MNITFQITHCYGFKRDVYGCKYVEQLTEEQRNSTAQEMIDYFV